MTQPDNITTKETGEPEDDAVTTLRLPSALWDDIKILGVRTKRSLRQIVIDGLRRELTAYEEGKGKVGEIGIGDGRS